jgi:hypothetical protein
VLSAQQVKTVLMADPCQTGSKRWCREDTYMGGSWLVRRRQLCGSHRLDWTSVDGYDRVEYGEVRSTIFSIIR